MDHKLIQILVVPCHNDVMPHVWLGNAATGCNVSGSAPEAGDVAYVDNNNEDVVIEKRDKLFWERDAILIGTSDSAAQGHELVYPELVFPKCLCRGSVELEAWK